MPEEKRKKEAAGNFFFTQQKTLNSLSLFPPSSLFLLSLSLLSLLFHPSARALLLAPIASIALHTADATLRSLCRASRWRQVPASRSRS